VVMLLRQAVAEAAHAPKVAGTAAIESWPVVSGAAAASAADCWLVFCEQKGCLRVMEGFLEGNYRCLTSAAGVIPVTVTNTLSRFLTATGWMK